MTTLQKMTNPRGCLHWQHSRFDSYLPVVACDLAPGAILR